MNRKCTCTHSIQIRWQSWCCWTRRLRSPACTCRHRGGDVSRSSQWTRSSPDRLRPCPTPSSSLPLRPWACHEKPLALYILWKQRVRTSSKTVIIEYYCRLRYGNFWQLIWLFKFNFFNWLFNLICLVRKHLYIVTHSISPVNNVSIIFWQQTCQ